MTPADYLKFIVALIFVLSLMGGLAYVLKRSGLAHGGVTAGKKRRLKLVESLPLDAKHKAVIIRRDAKEHLVILSANGETVIETDFEPPKKDETN